MTKNTLSSGNRRLLCFLVWCLVAIFSVNGLSIVDKTIRLKSPASEQPFSGLFHHHNENQAAVVPAVVPLAPREDPTSVLYEHALNELQMFENLFEQG
jgi:hypothetical protein